MADHDPTPTTPDRPIRRPDAVIDLRSETPVRHRQSRGVPREPDARMHAYRDRPVHPPITGVPLRARPIDLRPLTEEVSDPEGRHALHPLAETAAMNGAERRPATREPTPATNDEQRPDQQRLSSGRLIVKRLRLRSVAKVALTFYLCLFAVLAVAGTILWRLASREGWVTGWTGFLVDVGFTDAAVDGTTLAKASATSGAILVATATLMTIAAAIFYNQLSGLLGGVEVTLAVPKAKRRSRRQRRRDRRSERDERNEG